MTSLNPYLVKRQMTEVLEVHRGMSEDAATKAAVDLLDVVQIPEARRRVHMFPHEFSGGMRQRVMIAMALLRARAADRRRADHRPRRHRAGADPRAARQAEARTGMAIALITHDLGVIAGLADRVMVMYAGEVMERADVRPLFKSPQHPYTHGLLRSMPRLDEHRATACRPSAASRHLQHLPDGCRFRDRCSYAFDRCAVEKPAAQYRRGPRRPATWSR